MSTLEPRTGLERARGRRLDLMLAMQGLEKAVASAAPDQETWLADVRSTSSDVMAALRAHIDEVEGEDGLLAEMRFDAPRLTHMVEDLEREHQDLLAACDRLEEALYADSPDIRRGRRRALRLLGQLSLHRQAGADLVYEAYNVDIGGPG